MERKWRSKEAERQRGSTEEATVRRRREERGKEETESQVARTGTEVDERKRKERGKPESESKREAPEEQLWERIREGRKETNRKAEYRNLEGKHERSGWRERGDRGSESGDGHRESSCKAEPGRGGKEEQKAE